MVLIIDDEQDLVINYKMILEDNGIEVMYINNINDAIYFLENNFTKIKIVVIDIRLGDAPTEVLEYMKGTKKSYTGIGFKRYINDNPNYSELKLFFITFMSSVGRGEDISVIDRLETSSSQFLKLIKENI